MLLGRSVTQKTDHRCVALDPCDVCGGPRTLVTVGHFVTRHQKKRMGWLVGIEPCATCSYRRRGIT
jgi:hypothetical protein